MGEKKLHFLQQISFTLFLMLTIINERKKKKQFKLTSVSSKVKESCTFFKRNRCIFRLFIKQGPLKGSPVVKNFKWTKE